MSKNRPVNRLLKRNDYKWLRRIDGNCFTKEVEKILLETLTPPFQISKMDYGRDAYVLYTLDSDGEKIASASYLFSNVRSINKEIS